MKAVLDFVATAATISACVVIGWSVIGARVKSTRSLAVPKEPQSLQGANLKGDPTAKVAVIEYSDFQCPYCGLFARDTWPAIERQYVSSGKVLFVFRHFPLTRLHPSALPAAEAAECARKQGKFWEMHDLLFLDQEHLDAPSILRRADSLGLDSAAFQECVSHDAGRVVADDLDRGKKLPVSGTPAFFFGRVLSDGTVKLTQRLSGHQPLATFQAALDGLLATR